MSYVVKQLPTQATARTLQVIGGTWKPRIVLRLIAGPRRLSELKRELPGISQKVLIQGLRELQEHGVVARRVSSDLPLRVEYSATPLGASLEPVLVSLCQWGRQHAIAVGEGDLLEPCPDR